MHTSEGLPRITIAAQPSEDRLALVWVEGPVATREDKAGGYAIRLLPVAEMRDWGRIWPKEEA